MYFHARAHAGLFHWMHLGARGGGGQGRPPCRIRGSCAGPVLRGDAPATSFGQPARAQPRRRPSARTGSPIYPSIMNYAYNYTPGMSYSQGALRGASPLDENASPGDPRRSPFEKLK